MEFLILGLMMFLGLHSTRIFADEWRSSLRSNIGEPRWKCVYALGSIAGFATFLRGFGEAGSDPEVLWVPPAYMHHVAAALMMLSFILLTAAYIPHNSIKARLHHPMTLGIKVWALAHLLTNGQLHEVILFGSFLLWSVMLFRSARQRDAAAGTTYAPGTTGATVLTVLLGGFLALAFAHWLHQPLIGVKPF